MPKKKFSLKLKPHFGKVSIILIVVAALLIAADLVTKHFADTYFWELKIIPGFAEIQGGHHNTAAAFGGFDIGQPALIVLTFMLLAFMVFAFICLPEKHVILKTAVAIVIAGAIGNLVDRLVFNYVRDWFGLWLIVGVMYCNFADFYIVIGVALVALSLLFFDDWAVFPLTKSAKAAQAARRAEEDKKNADKDAASQPENPSVISSEVEKSVSPVISSKDKEPVSPVISSEDEKSVSPVISSKVEKSIAEAPQEIDSEEENK